MAKIGNIVEAVRILNPNAPNHLDVHLTGVDHDIIYLPFEGDGEVSDEDFDRLDDLGAFWDEDDEIWQMFA